MGSKRNEKWEESCDDDGDGGGGGGGGGRKRVKNILVRGVT